MYNYSYMQYVILEQNNVEERMCPFTRKREQ
jgi:hypothetical protein